MRLTALEVVLAYLGVAFVLSVFAAAALNGIVRMIINAFR